MGGFVADTTAIAVTLYLDPETKLRIDSLKPRGFTVNGFIRAAIAEHLKREHVPVLDPESLARIVSRA